MFANIIHDWKETVKGRLGIPGKILLGEERQSPGTNQVLTSACGLNQLPTASVQLVREADGSRGTCGHSHRMRAFHDGGVCEEAFPVGTNGVPSPGDERISLLLSPEPVGIKSAWGSMIENLFILPRAQNRGYGSRLLRFAMAMREGTPELWIPENNEGGRRYRRFGFRETGRVNPLSDTLREIRMVFAGGMGEL